MAVSHGCGEGAPIPDRGRAQSIPGCHQIAPILRAAAQKNVEPRSYQCARNASLSMSVLGAKRKAFASIELFKF
jgi:hypothetical protein